MLGHVTSSYDSVELGRTFALALLQGGRDLIGDTVYVVVDGVPQPVTVTSPVLVDPDGTRRDGVDLPPLHLAAVTFGAGMPVSPLAPVAERFAALSRRPRHPGPAGRGGAHDDGERPGPPGTVAGDAVAAALGVVLPDATGGRGDAGTDSVLALGPDEYLVTSGPGHGPALVERLTARRRGRRRRRLGGPDDDAASAAAGARRVLAHGCALDLSRLGSDGCAQTLLAQCAVVLVADGEPGAPDDLIKVLVRSTFAAHLAEWLLLTAQEYAG